MSKYTAEQVRDWLRSEATEEYESNSLESAGRLNAMADAIDALLRERESMVPEECTSEWSGGGDYDDGYHNGIINGWNGCREAMLAAAPKPEKE